MKKKILVIIIFTAIVISLFLLFQYTMHNLKSNSVYYAKNMPRGDGQYPEIIMLVENMNWVDKPYIEFIDYKSKGTNAIINTNTQEKLSNIYLDEHIYIYISKEDINYMFSKNMKLVFAKDYKKNISYDLKNIDTKEVIKEIKSFLSPIIEAQLKPIINL